MSLPVWSIHDRVSSNTARKMLATISSHESHVLATPYPCVSRRDWLSYQVFGFQLSFEVRVINRCGDHAGKTEGGLHQQHGDQQFPGAGVNLDPDDARVEEIFELVDQHQKAERSDTDAERDRQGGDGDG